MSKLIERVDALVKRFAAAVDRALQIPHEDLTPSEEWKALEQEKNDWCEGTSIKSRRTEQSREESRGEKD